MKNLPLCLLTLGLTLISHNANADPLVLFQLGKGMIDARKAQVDEACNRNMSASFFLQVQINALNL